MFLVKPKSLIVAEEKLLYDIRDELSEIKKIFSELMESKKSVCNDWQRNANAVEKKADYIDDIPFGDLQNKKKKGGDYSGKMCGIEKR